MSCTRSKRYDFMGRGDTGAGDMENCAACGIFVVQYRLKTICAGFVVRLLLTAKGEAFYCSAPWNKPQPRSSAIYTCSRQTSGAIILSEHADTSVKVVGRQACDSLDARSIQTKYLFEPSQEPKMEEARRST